MCDVDEMFPFNTSPLSLRRAADTETCQAVEALTPVNVACHRINYAFWP
jgi:hypothetical protein